MDEDVWELVCRARDDIRAGNIEEGLSLLDKVVAPKFRSSEHAHGAYLMFDGSEPACGLRDHFSMALGLQIAGAMSAEADLANLKSEHPLIAKRRAE